MTKLNRTIIIDEDAANLDIQRINRALPYLREARAALLRVREEGSNTRGETGAAVVEKANQLINRIDRLIASLSETQSNIRYTVRQNQELDASIAASLARQLG